MNNELDTIIDNLEVIDNPKEAISAYAKRLATRRVIAELKDLHRNQGGDLPKRDYDNETDEIIDERIEVLTATLTKEAES